jgi:hypothetical protein
MDQSPEVDKDYNQAMIHIDRAIERHLGATLDQSSASLVPDGTQSTCPIEEADPHENELQRELAHIYASAEYTNLVNDLAQHPPPIILQKKEPKTNKSFSLFDMMDANAFAGAGSLSLPPNIRDILDCQDHKEILSKCNNVRVQDLILGFNTTQAEVHHLSTLLHQHLLSEYNRANEGVIPGGISSLKEAESSSPSFLALHTKWIEECTKDEESISFAFLLAFNVILVSSHPSISTRQRFKVVKSLMTIFQCIMRAWNDAPTFQKAWLETLYLWIKCSFQRGAEETHLAWAYYDTKGHLFEKCLACMNSTLMIRLVFEKAGLMSHLRQILCSGCTPSNERTRDADAKADLVDDGTSIDNPKGLVLCHSLCLFKSLVLHSSVWTFPYLEHAGDDKVVQSNVPTIATLKDDVYWIQDVDKELKKVSSIKYKAPTCQLVDEYLLRPFIALLEIGAESPLSKPQDSPPKVARFGDTVDPFLIHICQQSIKHILHSCARDADLLSQVTNSCKSFQTEIDWENELQLV